jgi:hypothetical protein
MRIQTISAVLIASAATTIGLASTAQADTNDQFQSPTGNIACVMGVTNGEGSVACDIGDHTYVSPPKPPNCHLGWGDRFSLDQGSAPAMECHGDTLRIPGLSTLNYGQAQSAGAITCVSEPTWMSCTDTSTGHFFHVSRDSYQLG